MFLFFSKRPAALCAMYGLLSVIICLPLFDQPDALGTNDWDQHLFYYGSVLKSVVEYGQLPFWNPWYCGGNVLWQNPQIAILSPVYPLTAVMSLQLAMKVNIVLHYWIGFAGMHVLLTRVIGLTFLPAVIFLATLVTASGAPAIHLRVGHSVFLPGFYLPLQLFFFFRAFRTGAWRDIFLAAATLALMVASGGTHILPMSFAALGTFSIAAALAKRDWRPLLIVTAFTVFGVAYSAPKLLPVGLFVSGERFWDTRNPIEHPDRVTLDILRQTYLVPTQKVGGRLPQQRHGWHEYGNYIGPAGGLVIVIGVIWALARRRAADRWFGLSLALTTVMLFTLSLGEFSRFAPASLATHLPLFSSFRIPSRYTIPFIQFAALTTAWASAAWLSGPRLPAVARVTIAIACIGASAHLIAMNRFNLSGVFNQPAFDTSFAPMGGPSQITTDSESSAYAPGSPMLRALTEDRAFYYCYESLQTFRTALAADAQVIPEAPPPIEHRFSPNHIEFNYPGRDKPTRIYLNYNWSPGWTSTAGPIDATSKEVMSFVVMQPGQAGTFTFSFIPPGLYAGVAVFVIAIVISLVLQRRSRPHHPWATR